jgi:hypothetical protein
MRSGPSRRRHSAKRVLWTEGYGKILRRRVRRLDVSVVEMCMRGQKIVPFKAVREATTKATYQVLIELAMTELNAKLYDIVAAGFRA